MLTSEKRHTARILTMKTTQFGPVCLRKHQLPASVPHACLAWPPGPHHHCPVFSWPGALAIISSDQKHNPAPSLAETTRPGHACARLCIYLSSFSESL